MKRIFILIVAFSLCISCKQGSSYEGAGHISFNGKTYARTLFVDVVSPGQTAVIPEGNCTNAQDDNMFSDVFFTTRKVTLNSFSMCCYEVTQELYNDVMGYIPVEDKEHCYGNEIQKYRPVSGVTWHDAVQFCNKLSELCGLEPVFTITNAVQSKDKNGNKYYKDGTVTWDLSKNGYRLPTEAEWEYAARGAGRTEKDWLYKYSGSDVSKQVAWTSLNSSGYSDEDEILRTHEVGLKRPNALMIFDMSGNVAEWCMDWSRSVTELNDFKHGNRINIPDTDKDKEPDPILPKGNYDNHVIRGGSYSDAKGYSGLWQRIALPAYTGCDIAIYQGIRLVRRRN